MADRPESRWEKIVTRLGTYYWDTDYKQFLRESGLSDDTYGKRVWDAWQGLKRNMEAIPTRVIDDILDDLLDEPTPVLDISDMADSELITELVRRFDNRALSSQPETLEGIVLEDLRRISVMIRAVESVENEL